MGRCHEGVRILVACENVILRSGLRKILEREAGFQVVGEATDVQQTAKLATKTVPDILLIDLQMAGVSGLNSLRQFWTKGSKTSTLILSAVEARTEIATAFRAGVRGVVLKDSSSKVLIQGIRHVIAGKYWIGHESVKDLGAESLPPLESSNINMTARHLRLTRRELEIVVAVVSGFSNREIALEMRISEDAVKHQVTNVCDKLGVFSRLELVLFAIYHELVGAHRESIEACLSISTGAA